MKPFVPVIKFNHYLFVTDEIIEFCIDNQSVAVVKILCQTQLRRRNKLPSLKTTKNGCFHANDNLLEVPGVEGVPVLLDLEAGRVEVVADEVHVDLKLIKQVFEMEEGTLKDF